MTIPTLVTAAAGEPVSTTELLLHARQEETADEALAALYIRAARMWFEAATDRTLALSSWLVKLPAFSSCIELPGQPLFDVTSVKYLDADDVEQTLAAATYVVVTSTYPGRIVLAVGESWPVTAVHPEAVRITYRAGTSQGDVPELARQGIRLLATRWYESRGEDSAGGGIPEACQALAWACGGQRY